MDGCRYGRVDVWKVGEESSWRGSRIVGGDGLSFQTVLPWVVPGS